VDVFSRVWYYNRVYDLSRLPIYFMVINSSKFDSPNSRVVCVYTCRLAGKIAHAAPCTKLWLLVSCRRAISGNTRLQTREGGRKAQKNLTCLQVASRVVYTIYILYTPRSWTGKKWVGIRPREREIPRSVPDLWKSLASRND